MMNIDYSLYGFEHILEKPNGFSDCTSIITYQIESNKNPIKEILTIIDNIDAPSTETTNFGNLLITFFNLSAIDNPFDFIRVGEYWFHNYYRLPFFVFLSANNISIPKKAMVEMHIKHILSIRGPINYYSTKLIRKSQKKNVCYSR